MPQEAEGSGAEFDDDTGENGWEGTKEGVGHKRGLFHFGEGLGEKVRVVGTGDVKCALNWFSFVYCLE